MFDLSYIPKPATPPRDDSDEMRAKLAALFRGLASELRAKRQAFFPDKHNKAAPLSHMTRHQAEALLSRHDPTQPLPPLSDEAKRIWRGEI